MGSIRGAVVLASTVIDALAVNCSLYSSVRRFKSFKDMAISDHRS